MKPNYEDERGKITDLLVTPDYSITHITFTKDAVRGNHYHKETTQYDMVLTGKLICSQAGKEVIMKPQSVVLHKPEVPHAYQALEDSEIISICFGVRKGEDYSKDTYKLDIPLL